METRQNLMTVGEPIPWFVANSSVNPEFHVDTTAGRYQVFCLFGSMSHPGCRRIVENFLSLQETTQIFDVENFLFTGISIDPADQAQSCIMLPDHGVRWFWDFDRSISKSMGALSGQHSADESTVGYRPQTIIIDERLRVLKVIPIGQHPEAHVQQVANTTKGTAHRRFAVSLVLNAESFEGGFLRFPEFGRQLYAPPTGGAVVFSCSLLHEATPVTRGTRFVFLPFLYDDAAAAIRQQNLQYIAASDIEPK